MQRKENTRIPQAYREDKMESWETLNLEVTSPPPPPKKKEEEKEYRWNKEKTDSKVGGLNPTILILVKCKKNESSCWH